MAVKRIVPGRLERASVPTEVETFTNTYFKQALDYRIWVDDNQPIGDSVLVGDVWRNTSTNPHTWYMRMPNNTWVSMNAGTGYGGNPQSGIMSLADKQKLDGIAANANNYIHPTTNGNMHIPPGGSIGQTLVNDGTGSVSWQSASGGFVKAWVKFNAAGTILGGNNVSSIVYGAGTGDYTVTFTTPIIGHYAAVASTSGITYGGITQATHMNTHSYLTTSVVCAHRAGGNTGFFKLAGSENSLIVVQ
jgi:hypothetical protein